MCRQIDIYGYPCLGLGHVQQEAEPAVLAAGEAAAPPGRRQSDNNQYKMLPGPLYFISIHTTLLPSQL